MKPVLIVSATRLCEEEFRLNTLLGRSLARLSSDPLVSGKVAYQNSYGLPRVFNRAISEEYAGHVLAFTHDDVSLEEPKLVRALNEATAAFQVVGVAGTSKRRPGQPAWAFADDSLRWEDHEHLSGAVCHLLAEGRRFSRYGPAPRECKLLDGLFLAAEANVLLRSGVRFDERFAFHFYDMDFCREAERAGLRMGTWPIALAHRSGGSFGGPEWVRQLKLYRDKWRE